MTYTHHVHFTSFSLTVLREKSRRGFKVAWFSIRIIFGMYLNPTATLFYDKLNYWIEKLYREKKSKFYVIILFVKYNIKSNFFRDFIGILLIYLYVIPCMYI